MVKDFLTILILSTFAFSSIELLGADKASSLPTTTKKYVKGTPGKKFKLIRKKPEEEKTEVLPEEPASSVDLKDISELDISDIIEPNSDYQFTFEKDDSPFMKDLNPPPEKSKSEIEETVYYAPTDVDVSKILIKGIWLLDNGQRKALIQEDNNKTTIVSVGYKIGEGRIVSIKKDAIVVGFHSMKSSGVREYKEKVIYFNK